MNGWNNRDSLVNILTVVGSSQESRGFSHVRFKEDYESGNVMKAKRLSGNYDGTEIIVKIEEE